MRVRMLSARGLVSCVGRLPERFGEACQELLVVFEEPERRERFGGVDPECLCEREPFVGSSELGSLEPAGRWCCGVQLTPGQAELRRLDRFESPSVQGVPVFQKKRGHWLLSLVPASGDRG
jgi:hypothetical protein